jgi:hypothetical protein
MGLKEDLLRGIYSYGFEKPSAIQQRAIKPLIMMRDTIAQAQSGTGKTATFTIGECAPCGPCLSCRAGSRLSHGSHNLACRSAAEHRPECSRLPGSDPRADARAGHADREGRCGDWRLPGGHDHGASHVAAPGASVAVVLPTSHLTPWRTLIAGVYRRHQRAPGHGQAPRRRAAGCG